MKAQEWYAQRVEAYIEQVPMNANNQSMLRDASVRADGSTLVIECPSPVLRSIIERWATDGEPPPEPFERIRTQPK